MLFRLVFEFCDYLVGNGELFQLFFCLVYFAVNDITRRLDCKKFGLIK